MIRVLNAERCEICPFDKMASLGETPEVIGFLDKLAELANSAHALTSIVAVTLQCTTLLMRLRLIRSKASHGYGETGPYHLILTTGSPVDRDN